MSNRTQTHLFVANCTGHVHSLTIGENAPGARTYQLQPSEQRDILGDVDDQKAAEFIARARRYGAVDAASIHPEQPFAGICYSDREIIFRRVTIPGDVLPRHFVVADAPKEPEPAGPSPRATSKRGTP